MNYANVCIYEVYFKRITESSLQEENMYSLGTINLIPLQIHFE